MPATARRTFVGVLVGLTTLGWLWHTAVVGRVSPDAWNGGEYAGAESALSGWRAGLCRNVGVCVNWLDGVDGQAAVAAAAAAAAAKGKLQKVPDFVLDYAPYVYLHSEERFMPCDIGEHLMHTTPYLNYTPITSLPNRPRLENLNDLNKFGRHVYLTSDDDPSNPPEWLRGDRNVPFKPPGSDSEDDAGLSAAPSIILWTEKNSGIVDAFYFYFYSFNLGNTVAGWRFGNHVGDWEHTVVRFVDGQPVSMFFSEHNDGAAYEYAVVEKIGKRPVAYSARGSHANYASPGTHYYAIPFHLLADHTNKGHLWDPVKNSYLYHYDIATKILTPDVINLNAPTNWFHYMGRWGDHFYPLNDKRQYRVIGQYHYVNGPTGPKLKNLERTEICQNEGVCIVQPSLTYHLEGVDGPTVEGDDDLLWGSQQQEDVAVEFGGKGGSVGGEEPDFEGFR